MVRILDSLVSFQSLFGNGGLTFIGNKGERNEEKDNDMMITFNDIADTIEKHWEEL